MCACVLQRRDYLVKQYAAELKDVDTVCAEWSYSGFLRVIVRFTACMTARERCSDCICDEQSESGEESG